MANETTTKIKMDISDLKANIKEASRQIRLANSEFKAVSASMENWGQSADGLSAKLKQLNTVHDAEVKKLDALKQQYELVVKEQGENSRGAQELAIKINNQEAAVAKVDKAIRQYSERLNEVQSSSNKVETASQQLTNEINRQESELNQLKDRYKDVYLSQGEASDEAQQLANEITQLSAELQENKIKMAGADDAAEKLAQALDKTEDEAEQTTQGFSLMDGVLSGLISNGLSNLGSKALELVGSLFELTEATEEYRSMMAKVEGSANSFGYSVDFAKNQFKEFYGYLNDDQMATNAITNLMGMKVSTDTVTDAANAAIAVWSAYGDSIPIESLTESINETAQVAKVTGVMADAINWAKRSNEDWSNALASNKAAQEAFNKAIAEGETQEDAYSKALEACADTQERATLIADTLNQTYGKSKKTYDDLAGSLIEANKAELELKETQAELAETIQPLQTEFTKLQAKALKELTPAIEEVSNEFLGLTDDIDWDGATRTIGNLLETTAHGLKFVVENIEPITTGVLAMGTAWGTYKATQLAVNGVTKASNAILALNATATTASTTATIANATATTGATVATKALNLAQKASPWGLVAGLIAGATVALISWVKNASEASRTANENTVATDKLADAQSRLNEKLKENKTARDDAIESAQTEIESAGIMLDRLDELAKKENKTNAEKQLMKHYVDELNKAIPNLNLQYDAEKDALNMSTDAIRNNIEATKELMLAKASQENLVGIAQDLANAELQLAEATAQHETNTRNLTKAKEEATKASQAWLEAGSKYYGDEYDAMVKANGAQVIAQENFNKSKQAVDDATKSVQDLNKEFENTEAYAKEKLDSAELSKSLNSLIEQARIKGIEVPKAVADGIRTGKFALPASVEEMNALVNYNNMVQKATQAGVTIPTSISQGIQNGSLLPSQAVAQMNAWVNFNDLLSKSTAAGASVPQYIQDQIILGQLKPAEAVQMMKDLVEYNDLVAKSQQAGYDVPETIRQQIASGQMKPQQAVQYMKDLIQYQDMLAKAQLAGVAVPENIKTGVNSGQTKPKDAVDQINALMIQSADSVAPKMNESGAKSSTQYAEGIGSKQGDVETKSTQIAEAGKSKLDEVDATPSGENMGQGFANGISNMIDAVIGAAADLASAALGALGKTGKEGSPWRTTIQKGRWAGEGLAIGLNESQKMVSESAENLANTAIGSIQSKMTVNDLLNMNEIKAGLSTNVNGIKSRSIHGQQSKPVVNQYFTQNNYSPKALSRLDIYRQTKSALKSSKGGS